MPGNYIELLLIIANDNIGEKIINFSKFSALAIRRNIGSNANCTRLSKAKPRSEEGRDNFGFKVPANKSLR